jgi:extracellular factor (EF) 3-hydroxypalmitic acid methyl ester biosynthesis protein
MRLAAGSREFDVERFFRNEVAEYTRVLSDVEARLDPDAEPADDAILQQLTAAFHKARDDCREAQRRMNGDARLLKQVQVRFRETVAPWLDRSWFMRHAKTKPSGYPGDYQMLTAIYDGAPRSRGLAGYFDLYFLNTELARAVRSRLAAVKQFLIAEALRRTNRLSVLNVASGPGREYAEGLRRISGSIQLTCIDTDQNALDYLQRHIDPEAADELDLSCVQYNALKTASPTANIARFGRPDLIYSVGLCDYIPDKYLVRILRGWRESLAPEGIVYVAFKDAPRYHPAEYQWFVDWYFYERTETDCRDLFRQAGYDADRLEMYRDETGIIMNFSYRLGAAQRQQPDGDGTGCPAVRRS